jgi:hypothetical protein
LIYRESQLRKAEAAAATEAKESKTTSFCTNIATNLNSDEIAWVNQDIISTKSKTRNELLKRQRPSFKEY